jgi:mono/diheme cytochrome c family protein
MTEVPDYLLKRSRERRAALGSPTGGATPASGDEGAAEASEDASASTAAAAMTPSTPATPAPEAAPAPPTTPPRARVTVPPRRVPMWMMPVLLLLPLWAVVYPGALQPHKKSGPVDPLVLGAEVYASAGCSGCHGATGGGGVGPALHAGEAVKTFPNEADQVSWVKTGSGPFTGKKYGDPAREGGQHGPATGQMPAFGASLSEEQINAVVKYEREKL